MPSSPSDGDELDALILGGGADVDPARYEDAAEAFGEVLRAASDMQRGPTGRGSSRVLGPIVMLLRQLLAKPFTGLDPARDELERKLLDVALRRDWPVLGICRGAQLLNVHYGGTLYQDLKEFYVERPQLRTVLPRKVIAVAEESRLAGIVGSNRLLVNSLHRQAVRTLGAGLAIVARETTGVVQAIEDPAHRFRIGVQWHPEFIPQHPRHARIFAELVACARRAPQGASLNESRNAVATASSAPSATTW